MIAYLYDINNYYIGETILQESPLEKNVYFDQPNSTRISPPICNENEIPIWKYNHWEKAYDYSNKIYYSKINKSIKIFTKGEPFDLDYTDLVPPLETYIIWKNDSWEVDNNLKSEYLKNQCKINAKKQIASSDWSVLPDVNISNKSEFENYRTQIRNLIINPVEDPIFPKEPNPIWSN